MYVLSTQAETCIIVSRQNKDVELVKEKPDFFHLYGNRCSFL